MQRFAIHGFLNCTGQQKSPNFPSGQSAGSLPEEARKATGWCQSCKNQNAGQGMIPVQ
jgi:hypothetical protein